MYPWDRALVARTGSLQHPAVTVYFGIIADIQSRACLWLIQTSKFVLMGVVHAYGRILFLKDVAQTIMHQNTLIVLKWIQLDVKWEWFVPADVAVRSEPLFPLSNTKVEVAMVTSLSGADLWPASVVWWSILRVVIRISGDNRWTHTSMGLKLWTR